MAQDRMPNWSYVTEDWQLYQCDRWWEGKHVFHVISRCRCRIKSYLKVTLSPSSTVMLSGRCPNSAPCTLDPAKKNERRVQSASNKNTRHSASVHLSQVRYLKIDHLTKSFRPEMCPASCLLWRESNKYTKQKSHNVCTDPHTWIMIWFYPAFWWAARSLNSTDNEQREEDSRGAAGAWNEGTATVTEGMLILPTNTHTHTHPHRKQAHACNSTNIYYKLTQEQTQILRAPECLPECLTCSGTKKKK